MREEHTDNLTIRLIKGDITEQETDVVVNAANKQLAPGGGVAGAIHRKAGPDLWEECRKIGGCDTGEAVITEAYNLPSSRIIHTVGPIYSGTRDDSEMLESSYINSLKLGDENELESISFPAISTGAFGYPLREAAEVAIDAVCKIQSRLKNIKLIQFVLFDDKAYSVFNEVLEEAINDDR